MRDIDLLCTEPVVFFFSLWVHLVGPLVFTTNHKFNLEQNGAVFAIKIKRKMLRLVLTFILAMCVGSLISTVISVFQEEVTRHYGKASSTPEGRLYFSCVQGAFLPIGLFWFAWTLAPSVHWIVPAMAIGCATMGLFSINLAVFNYSADTYHPHSPSCTLRSFRPKPAGFEADMNKAAICLQESFCS